MVAPSSAVFSVLSSFSNLCLKCGFLILSILSVCYACPSTTESDDSEHLLCRQCGHEVALAGHFTNMPSKLSLRRRNDTLFGVNNTLIQLFMNPQGKHFELITSTEADLLKYGNPVSQYSWFPDHSWQVAVCPRCGFHIGWSFERLDPGDSKESKKHSFYGLILDSLHHHDYADSLLIKPKFYS